MDNEWRDIPGYNGRYQINREGDIRSWAPHGGRYSKGTASKPHILKQYKNQRRYVVYLKNGDNKHAPVSVFRLMVKTWFGDIPDGMVSYHKNGDIRDHNINNIGFVTKQQLGKMTGGKMNRKPVKRLDKRSGQWEFFPSVTAAAKASYMSYASLRRRMHGDFKEYAKEQYVFAFDDDD
jgi:hypothetical protein